MRIIDSGSALRDSHPAREPWLHCHRRTHPGARYRREHGDFQRCERRAASPASFSRPVSTGSDRGEESLSRDFHFL